MVADMHDTVAQLHQCLTQAGNTAGRADAASHLGEIADALAKTADFFDLASTKELAALLAHVASRLTDVPDATLPALLTRLESFGALIAEQAAALEQKQAVIWPMQTHQREVEAMLDGADHAAAVAAAPAASASPQAPAAEGDAVAIDRREAERREGDRRVGDRRAPAGGAGGAAATPDATIRVEVSRLESLLNLVGQMVLNKNRMLGLGRKLRNHPLPLAMMEDIGSTSNELDRLTSELQVAVMRTRMQPLTKLFERYPRVIRDMARTLNKKITLELEGGDTEVDKSVLELLADPLVHLLRNSADHGIEAPEARRAAGKPETGVIRLSAAHQGSHVRVEIHDDGKGIDAKAVAKKALEKGLITADKLATLSESEIYQFIFAPGLSTAEKVTDFSGRGVGMDVVHTNIVKMNGVVNVTSARGKGTSIEVLIPLTVAIMPAMVVGVGRQVYCVPLQSIREIVKPEADAVHGVRGQPVMRLRDSILPLIDLRSRLDEASTDSAGAAEEVGRFAVVVGVGAQAAGLRVDRLIGRQEIVIKPLDDKTTRGGPFSGATILEDGGVSLILDVVQLVRQASAAGRPPMNTAGKSAA
jgi:two-component system chemotaxis sensor kinase CheA